MHNQPLTPTDAAALSNYVVASQATHYGVEGRSDALRSTSQQRISLTSSDAPPPSGPPAALAVRN